MVELTSNDPALILHTRFLRYQLDTYEYYYQFMQSLHIIKLISEQLDQLANKLTDYTMVNYEYLREHIRQIDENYPDCMMTWLLILTTELWNLMMGTRISILLYWKQKCTNSS